jgi:hypothetical protein
MTSDEPAGPKKPWGKPFAKSGDPRQWQNGLAAEDSLTELADGDLDLYAAMKHVLTRPKSEDRTEIQRTCRAWKAKNLSIFMARFADLEKARLAERSARANRGYAPERDEQSEKIEATLEELIKRCVEQSN